MQISDKARQSLKLNNLITLVPILAVLGATLTLFSVIWDAASHVLSEPEFFWSIQHVAVYSGVAMMVSSAILGSTLLIKKQLNNRVSKGIKLIIAGAVILIAAGFGDSISHDLFGSGEVVSISHVFLESAPALSAFGSILVLNHVHSKKAKKLIPLAIFTTILSAGSVIFNISMVFGGALICISVYQLLSYGCAIL